MSSTPDNPLSLTERLRQFSSGDRSIAEDVISAILPELHRIASRELGRERYSPVLSATELINEVWLRNLRKGGWQISSREHFYAIAAAAMRQVLIDFARARLSHKRGRGDVPQSVDAAALIPDPRSADIERVFEIGLLVDRLEKADPAGARIVDLHYFAGFTLAEIAEIHGLSLRQVRHQWDKTSDWLRDRLT